MVVNKNIQRVLNYKNTFFSFPSTKESLHSAVPLWFLLLTHPTGLLLSGPTARRGRSTPGTMPLH